MISNCKTQSKGKVRFRRNDIGSSDIFLVNRNGIPNFAGIPTGKPNLAYEGRMKKDKGQTDNLDVRTYVGRMKKDTGQEKRL